MKNIQSRFLFIDGLRGIAAIAVAAFHFYYGGPLREPLSNILPPTLCLLLKHGWLGVEIFFVISGFVIAYSFHKAEITANFLRSFALRRFLRLGLPYWATIAFTILVNYASNFFLNDRGVPLPGINMILAHIFYVQNILGLGDIVPVFWTLCLEIQFYLVFAILLSISQLFLQQISHNFKSTVLLIIFVPLAVVSLVFGKIVDNSLHAYFLPYWYMFFVGVILWWVIESKFVSAWFWLYIAAIAAKFVIQSDIRAAIVIATVLSIYLASQLGQMHKWLDAKWIQYIGKISYSFYLVHIVFGMRVINLGYRLSGDSPIVALIWFLLAFAISIIMAHLTYILIEKPSIELSKKLKFKAA